MAAVSQRSRRTVCTVVTKRQLAKARVLCASVCKHNPGVRPHVLVVDATPGEHWMGEPFGVVEPVALDLPTDDFAKMALIYDAAELCLALAPWVVEWCLQQHESVLYVSSEGLVCRSLDDAWRVAEEEGIVIARRWRGDAAVASGSRARGGEHEISSFGAGRSGRGALEGWKRRLLAGSPGEPSLNSIETEADDGRLATTGMSVQVLHSALRRCGLSTDHSGQLLWEGCPIDVIHFGGCEPASVSDAGSTSASMRPMDALLDNVYKGYCAALEQAGHRESSEIPYAFGTLPSGDELTPERRRSYRAALLRAEEDPANSAAARVQSAGPLVSVVVPTRDRARFLSETLLSIVQQTYRNIEVLVLDDCSSDATLECAETFARRDGRFRVLANETALGAVDNHNRGLSLAAGEFVKFVHDDDRLRPHAIERLVAAASSYPDIALATSCRAYIDESGSVLPVESPCVVAADSVIDGRTAGNHMLVTANNYVGEPTTALFRRAMLPRGYAFFGGRTYSYLADVASWLFLVGCGPVALLTEVLSETRVHRDQENRRLGHVRENLEWLTLIGDARAHGYLDAEGDEAAALRAVVPRLAMAAASAPFDATEDVIDAMRGSFERLRELTGAPASIEWDLGCALAR